MRAQLYSILEGDSLKNFEVSLHSVSQVKDFVALANEQPFSLTVGTGRRSVNGKSFMQLFSLDLSKPLQVSMDCTEEAFARFFEAAAPFRN